MVKNIKSPYRLAVPPNIPCALLLLVGLLWLAGTYTTVHAAEPVKIGVTAFRPKPQTLAQWQPLAVALKKAMPEHDFVVEALTFPEMERAVATHRIDFVLTNPGYYVLLTKRLGLSSPLATMVVNESGKPTRVFGGVIFSRADRAAMGSLSALKGKTLAVTMTESLGGYQMQAYELKRIGIRLPQDAKLLMTGMPQDKVVEAVLEGRADAGFVRTGVLEAMEREGRLDMAKLKIVNRQFPPGFPVQVSTRLYPEWAFAALPHIDVELARHVAATLYLLDENPAVTKAMNIQGFVIPEDYTPVADMLRELRMPPYEAAPEFTLQDVLHQYRWETVAALIAILLILFLLLRLILANRKLDEAHRLVLQQKQQMQQLAFYDMLTMLPNRRLLHDRLSQTMAAAKRSGRYSALLFIDLDNFKPLNDRYGHEVGDLLLVEVASRLKNCTREMDTVARLGGDEFVVILSELDVDKAESTSESRLVAEKIRFALSAPYRLVIKEEGRAETIVEHHCTASIGVVVFFEHEVHPDDILKWADAAMYQAKESGRNRVCFHQASA